MKNTLQVGLVLGRLTLVQCVPSRLLQSGTKSRWICQCSCGFLKSISAASIRSGDTKSCGCLRKELAAAAHTVHGGMKDPLYSVWMGMRTRCSNPNSISYKWYGGRGVSVAKVWDDFARFKRDLGDRPGPEYTLDRINNDGNYEPGNVRWATGTEQYLNSNRVKYLEVWGRVQPFILWAKEFGISPALLENRIRQGESVEAALTRPKGVRRNLYEV